MVPPVTKTGLNTVLIITNQVLEEIKVLLELTL